MSIRERLVDSNEKLYPAKIKGEIHAEEVVISPGAVVEEGAVISGYHGKKSQRVFLGPFSYIGKNTKIFASEFSIGDYSKWHEGGFGYGEGELIIGRCCWFGGGVVLDPKGGLVFGDGVGGGAGSQFWTHIEFGDVVQGNRWHGKKRMEVGEDAWFVGHCLVSPVSVEPCSMALQGSVVTRDMEYNRVYAGVPAKDITEKVGPQFAAISPEEKISRLKGLFEIFFTEYPEYKGRIEAIQDSSEARMQNGVTYFNVEDRQYYGDPYNPAGVQFLRFTSPRAKFYPKGKYQPSLNAKTEY